MFRLPQFLILIFLIFTACQNEIEKSSPTPTPSSKSTSPPAKFVEKKFTYAERELDYLLEIWSGEYDNVEQLDFDSKTGKTKIENGQHLRIHSFAKKLEQTNFGKYAIYIEEYKNDNPTDIYRQCIYQFIADDKNIRVKVFHFKNPTPYLSIQKELDFSQKIKPKSPLLEEGCEMMLQREGMAFRGKTIQKDCINHPTNNQQTIDYQFLISENEYWFEEKIYDKGSQKLLSDDLQQSPFQLEKSRCFACMIDFPREKGGRPVKTEHYIKIHDQGGKFEFDYSDGKHMVLGMRNTWSFGMQRETFVIFIQEENQKGKTLIYSWGNPGADRIGFNPGWIRVQCDLDTPKNVALQHALRPDS